MPDPNLPAAPRFGRLADGPAPAPGGESFLDLASAGAARVERIASQAVVDGEWYDQAADEFVLLVAGAAELELADGRRQRLAPGDWALLPAHCRHRVAWTAPDELTLWLAVHLPPAVGAT